jgi:16S rRNA (cytosine967-C5)-methyltransferase
MPSPDVLPIPGLAPRRVAADILEGVLGRRRPLDDWLDGPAEHPGLAGFDDRDRALTRQLVATVLRRLGTLRHIVAGLLDRGMPADTPRVETALLLGAAQILLLKIPDHAAVDLSVRLVQADRRAARYAGLVNAVLRRLTREGVRRLQTVDAVLLDTPDWLMQCWTASFGEETARAIASAHAHEPPLDLTVKGDPSAWAARLGGRVLPTGSVRLVAAGPVSALPGYAEGEWWVQDAAAALPARLFGDVQGLRIADLCAAPGGKTAQLAHCGAQVIAVDRSESRLARLKDNLKRLRLSAETVVADAAIWQAGPFDAVLLDAPCSSTGTIRRHPDIVWLKRETDLKALVALQRRLLDRAVEVTRPGGTIVYCTCSLEREEGEDIVAALLEREQPVRRKSIVPADVCGRAEFITPLGDLRTLPCHFPDPDSRWSGLDGFYAARLERL